MKKRKSIYIGDVQFASKTAAQNYVRELLEPLKKGAVVSEGEMFDFLLTLLQGHPEAIGKIGPGVKYFSITTGRSGGAHITIVRCSGPPIDVSWLTCISGKPMTLELKLRHAMRAAVDSQISQFRAELQSTAKCAVCGVACFEDLDIDHAIPFATLVQDFLLIEGGNPTEFDDCPTTFRAIFRAQDSVFQQRWERYHSERATLQPTHKRCNRSKGRRVA